MTTIRTNLRRPTQAELLQVRAIGRAIARTINVGGWDNQSVAARIEFGEAMIAAGFDMSFGSSMTLENHYLALAQQHGHSSLCVLLMKVA